MKNNKHLIFIGLLSVLIISFVLFIVYFNQASSTVPVWTEILPAVNAIFNFITSTFLVLGFIEIKKGNIDRHKKYMLSAVMASLFFLVGYSTYHILHGETKFIATGLIRYIYFFLLISHIVLSFIQVPLILTTLYHAYQGNMLSHKKVARWTLPIWLYVSVTGVLVFIFLHLLND